MTNQLKYNNLPVISEAVAVFNKNKRGTNHSCPEITLPTGQCDSRRSDDQAFVYRPGTA
jgi:hypothetical protein